MVKDGIRRLDEFCFNNPNYVPTEDEKGAMNEGCKNEEVKLEEEEEGNKGDDRSGSTLNMVLITPSKNKITCVNVGDSRTTSSTGLNYSEDHKPTNESERARIENAGGYVSMKRVDGDLAVSRALGDFCYKNTSSPNDWEEYKVTACPDVKRFDLTGVDWVVTACDGIWDVFTSSTIKTFIDSIILEMGDDVDCGKVCERVMDEALERGSKDNMSVVFCFRKGKGGGV